MSEKLSRRLAVFLKGTRTTEGKITIFTSVVACFVLVCFVTLFQVNVPVASADDVTTSVTVLNTPPTFDTDVFEVTASATTTPTNSGSVIQWQVTASDSSNDRYYLLICKTSAAATANSGAAPTCNGGISNQWAVSASASSSVSVIASTTTVDYFPFNAEKNDWYAFICDNNATLARCNLTVNQGTPGNDNASPFVINHVPVFHSISNNGPINPGGILTWTSGSYDNDTLGSSDQVRLIVCASPGISNGACSSGGGFASSTLTATNAATSSTFAIPTQDRFYDSYAYIVDTHNHAATSTLQASNSVFQIQNVAPTIDASTITFIDYNQSTTSTGLLTLTTPQATSGPFKLKFTVVDNNSCLNASSTAEIASTTFNAYRSGVTAASCISSSDYNTNSCYAAASPNFIPFVSCTQDVGSCSGATDSDATFTCTFSLWYNADPTDASTQYTAQNWLANVRAGDDDFGTSAYTELTGGGAADVVSFLAFDVSTTTIVYGSLEPGATTTTLFANTDLRAVGNVGLDEDVYGDPMCTDWSVSDRCASGGHNSSNTIPVTQQVVATGTVAYTTASASTTVTGTLPASTTPRSILINVPKTISTSSVQSRDTYWGIAIPLAITQAGSYTGQNTITAKKSNPSNW